MITLNPEEKFTIKSVVTKSICGASKVDYL